jgi:hypothetical protein
MSDFEILDFCFKSDTAYWTVIQTVHALDIAH